MFTRHDVTAVELLSLESWENTLATTPNVPVEQHGVWWLCSPGCNKYFAAVVHPDGCARSNGYGITHVFGIRPVFCIPYLKLNGYMPGDKVMVEKTVCTVITNFHALADRVICRHRFGFGNNEYKSSEIREYIHSEEFWRLL